jgi:hypothetical protein
MVMEQMLATEKEYDWVPASNGAVPPGAVVGGHEPGRDRLYVCRAKYNGEIHPGKLVANCCNIGWWGQEISIPDYEVLVSSSPSSLQWVPASNGAVPPGAVVGGYEPGRDLYVSRAEFKGGVHPGKLVANQEYGCCIGWGNKEEYFKNYEVLVCLPLDENLSIQVGHSPENSLDTALEEPHEERHGDYVCTVQKVQVKQSFEENLALDPLSDSLWPGAILDGASIPTGGYRPITANRAPLTISSADLQVDGPPYITVQDPKLSTVRDGIAQLLRRAKPQTAAEFAYEAREIHSENQLAIALGAHYKKGSLNFSGNADFSRESVKNKVLVQFVQKYYTLAIDKPAHPSSFFAEPRTIGADEMYVASVTYGRRLLFLMQSSEDKTKLMAAANVATKKGGGEVSAEYEQVLKNAEIYVWVLGGGGCRWRTNDHERCSRYPVLYRTWRKR